MEQDGKSCAMKGIGHHIARIDEIPDKFFGAPRANVLCVYRAA